MKPPNPWCASGAELFRVIVVLNAVILFICGWAYFYEYNSYPSLEDDIDLPTPQKRKGWNFTEFASTFTCQDPNWCDTYYSDSEEAQAYLHRLQFPPNCSEARFLVLPYEPVSGLGSVLHQRGQFMGLAVHENRTFIVNNVAWSFGRVCDPPTFECYFMPLTHCNLSLHAPNWKTAPELMRLNGNYSERVVRLPNQYMKSPEDVPRRADFIPEPFKHKDIYWWHAQASKFVVRPNERSTQIFKDAQKKVFPPDGEIPHPIISMYVRHGDKFKEAKLLNFSLYMDIVKKEVSNVRHIYLGTDDPLVIEEATQNKSYSEYTFHYINTTRYNGAPLDFLKLNNGGDLMNVSLSDLFLQIQGDVFIGTRSSNWCRLIDELRKADGKAKIPFFTPEPLGQMLIVK